VIEALPTEEQSVLPTMRREGLERIGEYVKIPFSGLMLEAEADIQNSKIMVN
jgi:septum formation topological specificity factor MinE